MASAFSIIAALITREASVRSTTRRERGCEERGRDEHAELFFDERSIVTMSAICRHHEGRSARFPICEPTIVRRTRWSGDERTVMSGQSNTSGRSGRARAISGESARSSVLISRISYVGNTSRSRRCDGGFRLR